MRTRFTMLAATLCGVAALAVPVAASAAPHHNRGLTIAVTPDPINAGEGVLIYGQLNGSDNAGQTVRLYHRVNPAPRFTLISVTKTDQFGFYHFVRADGIVETNRNWFVRGPAGTHSRTVHERVHALVTLAADRTSATTSQRVTFTGVIVPRHSFQRVLLQEQVGNNGNGWRTIARGLTNGHSIFTIAHRFRVPGDYTLRAVFRGDRRNSAGASDSVTVAVQQAQVPGFTIQSASPIISEGQSVTISGVVDQPGTATPMATTQVTLYGRLPNRRFVALATTVTGTDGSYSFQGLTPVYNTVYYVAETLTPHHRSARLFEGVQDVVTITPGSATTTVGGAVQFTGTVSPSKAGHAIYLQLLGPDGHWHDIGSGVVSAPGSTYSLSYTFGQSGTFTVRARIYGGPWNIGAPSPAVSVTVSGTPPVTALPPAS